jgi:hypothetical protein
MSAFDNAAPQKRRRDVSSNSNTSPPKKKTHLPDPDYLDSLGDIELETLMCTFDLKTLVKFSKVNKRANAIFNDPLFQRQCVYPKAKEVAKNKGAALGKYKVIYERDELEGDRIYGMELNGVSFHGFTYHYTAHYDPYFFARNTIRDESSDEEEEQERYVNREEMTANVTIDIPEQIAHIDHGYIVKIIGTLLDASYSLFETFLGNEHAERGNGNDDDSGYIQYNIRPYNLEGETEGDGIEDVNGKVVKLVKKHLKKQQQQQNEGVESHQPIYHQSENSSQPSTKRVFGDEKAKKQIARQVADLAVEIEQLVMITPDTPDGMKAKRSCYERARNATTYATLTMDDPNRADIEDLKEIHSKLLACKTVLG